MKLIIAIVRPEAMEPVKESLYKQEIKMLTVIDVQGHGRQMGHTEVYRGREYQVDFLNKIELQIALPDDRVDVAIDAIMKGAKTGADGAIGDGKIFVLPLERAIRIRTGERDEQAV